MSRLESGLWPLSSLGCYLTFLRQRTDSQQLLTLDPILRSIHETVHSDIVTYQQENKLDRAECVLEQENLIGGLYRERKNGRAIPRAICVNAQHGADRNRRQLSNNEVAAKVSDNISPSQQLNIKYRLRPCPVAAFEQSASQDKSLLTDLWAWKSNRVSMGPSIISPDN